MSLFCRIMQTQDFEQVWNFEENKMREAFPDEMERMFAQWNSRARKEAMEHYIPMGWSFIAFDEEEKLVGYFLAQPLLFLDGQTQSLWVEHVQYASLQARDELCELAYKLSREKHFQRVYFPNANGISNSISTFKPENWVAPVLMVKTTKANT